MSVKLNPQITEIVIGVRELRNITVYPLSIGQQLKVKSMVVEIVTAFDSMDDEAAFLSGVSEAIQNNLEKVVGFVTDPADKVSLDEITNDQFADLLSVVTEANFESPGKKIKEALGKAKNLLALKK